MLGSREPELRPVVGSAPQRGQFSFILRPFNATGTYLGGAEDRQQVCLPVCKA